MPVQASLEHQRWCSSNVLTQSYVLERREKLKNKSNTSQWNWADVLNLSVIQGGSYWTQCRCDWKTLLLSLYSFIKETENQITKIKSWILLLEYENSNKAEWFNQYK